jgi:hypothetical protein
MDPTITKASTGNEGLVAACAESQSTSRGPNRTRFLAVQAVIRAKMQCDKKTFLTDADASKKRNLLLVGGHADNTVEVCGEGNADAKRPCLGKGQTMLTKPPSQAEFEECWSEAIIKNGLSPSLVDDRKALVTTLVVTSALTSADVNLTSVSRSPDETDGAAGSVTHSIFVRFTSNFVHLHSLPPLQGRIMSRFSLINFLLPKFLGNENFFISVVKRAQLWLIWMGQWGRKSTSQEKFIIIMNR